VLLGNLSQSGDNKSLETGVRLAAETGRRVWTVSGNHDCFERLDALEVAMRRVAADNVRLASPAGEVVGREPRVAGLCPMSGSRRYRARSNGGRGAEAWGDDPTVWLSPYPMVSFAEEVSSASLILWGRSRRQRGGRAAASHAVGTNRRCQRARTPVA
jgi:hypothetical protein